VYPVILIIDDDASVRAASDNLLTSLGYAVYTFVSAEEFLRSAHLNDTLCVIADVQMPGMSGVDLQARLLTQGCRVPFIFITAFPDVNGGQDRYRMRRRVSRLPGLMVGVVMDRI
jgi:FixJ family two-component response regulator